MDIFRYLFCMMFSDRSIYMQMKTGIYEGSFSKNTIYRFLNNAGTNWQRFTILLSAADDRNLLCEAGCHDAVHLPEEDAASHAVKPRMP